jgi:uncharacterized protein YbjT (DUF2867 family)
MRILVTGASGTIGSAVCEALSKEGRPVVAASRNVPRDRDRFDSSIAVRAFDFSDPDTFGPALEGIQGLYLVAPVVNPRLVELFLDQVDKSDLLDYLVFSSGRTTGGIPGKPLNVIEERIKNGHTPFTIIRPGWFMQNFLGWLGPDIRDHQCIALPAADAKTTFVDVRDLAEAAANLYAQPAAHLSKTYDWVGEEALTHSEVAQLFSQALGHSIVYQDLPEEEYVERLVAAGTSRASAQATAFLYNVVRSGQEASSTDHLRKLLGRAPRTFQTFIQDHLEFWKSPKTT